MESKNIENKNVKILSGVEFAEATKEFLKGQVELLEKDCNYPRLTVVQVGEDPASGVYIRQKKNFGKAIGVPVRHLTFPETITTEDLIIEIINIYGPVIVQLPLPRHIDTDRVMDVIEQDWDVDGFTIENLGKVMKGEKGLQPCTPKGIIKLLKHNNIELEGKHAIVVGRSDIVGKPVAMMLLHENCTVTICHSKTKNLKEICSQADILVVAMGQPEYITADYVKEGAVVVDVGIHRTESGKLVGDVKFDEVSKKASAITPVPNGVGRCTVAMLFENVIQSYL